MTFDLTMYGEAYCSFAVTIGFAVAASVCADDNVRAVQEKLRDGGFYTGEIDGAYSSELAAALTRYQVRKGLAVTGQLPVDTSNALDARPAVTKDTTASEQSSETWRRLRERDRQATTSAQRSETAATEAREASSPRTFPLRYELRNGTTYSSGTINKTLVLEPVGDDLQIVAVSESKAD